MIFLQNQVENLQLPGVRLPSKWIPKSLHTPLKINGCLDVPLEVSKWLVNGVYWGYNPLANLLLTSWDIQVEHNSMEVLVQSIFQPLNWVMAVNQPLILQTLSPNAPWDWEIFTMEPFSFCSWGHFPPLGK